MTRSLDLCDLGDFYDYTGSIAVEDEEAWEALMRECEAEEQARQSPAHE